MHSDSRENRSRLPEGREYWDELAGRVSEATAPTVAAYRREPSSLWSWWGDSSAVLAACAVAAIVLTWLWAPEPSAQAGADDALRVVDMDNPKVIEPARLVEATQNGRGAGWRRETRNWPKARRR